MPRLPRARAQTPTALDVAVFCRDGGQLEGHWALPDLPRFAESVLRGDDAGPMSWRVAGSLQAVHGGGAQHRLDLDAQATVVLECQRCLQPLRLTLQVQRRFIFVAGEDEAARLDEELEDDVLALEPRLDLRTLIEDELLLALPLVPRHEHCPELPAALQPRGGTGERAGKEFGEEPAAEHPFAALAALRRGKD